MRAASRRIRRQERAMASPLLHASGIYHATPSPRGTERANRAARTGAVVTFSSFRADSLRLICRLLHARHVRQIDPHRDTGTAAGVPVVFANRTQGGDSLGRTW